MGLQFRTRFNYLRYLIRVAFQRDNPFELPFVEVKRVREFRYSNLITLLLYKTSVMTRGSTNNLK